jgi:hypothetical protein
MDDFAQISIEAFARDVAKRLRAVEKSLGSLQNQDGEYANHHRRLLGMYGAVKATVDEAARKSK